MYVDVYIVRLEINYYEMFGTDVRLNKWRGVLN